MPHKCARNGCPANQTPQHNGTHLCETHYHQFLTGAIGWDFDPASRQYPTRQIAALITHYDNRHHPTTHPTPLRQLAKELNTTKDTLHHILTHKWQHVKSKPAEQILDAIATQYHNHTPKPTTLHISKKRATTRGNGEQLKLF